SYTADTNLHNLNFKKSQNVFQNENFCDFLLIKFLHNRKILAYFASQKTKTTNPIDLVIFI
ncbi:MAG: hypothetical protein K2J42_09290, partial [Muribaculaceae bacterium]|nr:hypothetical protein [Muribaculaceae bacterium]